MNPDGPDISVPGIPLAAHLVREGHYDAAGWILAPVIAHLIMEERCDT